MTCQYFSICTKVRAYIIYIAKSVFLPVYAYIRAKAYKCTFARFCCNIGQNRRIIGCKYTYIDNTQNTAKNSVYLRCVRFLFVLWANVRQYIFSTLKRKLQLFCRLGALFCVRLYTHIRTHTYIRTGTGGGVCEDTLTKSEVKKNFSKNQTL